MDMDGELRKRNETTYMKKIMKYFDKKSTKNEVSQKQEREMIAIIIQNYYDLSRNQISLLCRIVFEQWRSIYKLMKFPLNDILIIYFYKIIKK